MTEPKFQSTDGMAATVLIAALMAELMDNGRLGTAGRRRILEDALFQLDRVGGEQAAHATALIIAVFGLENRVSRLENSGIVTRLGSGAASSD